MTQIDSQNDHSRDWMNPMLLRGLVALVAGGGSGIGEAAARTLAANGAIVAVTDRDGAAAERVAASIGATGGTAIGIALDVTAPADIDAGVARTVETFGKLDILVNSAGVLIPGMLETCPLDQWRTSFLVNVDGALLLGRACLPHLRRSAHAAVVNVTSLAGSGRGYPNGGAYGPSKSALLSLTRQMALEWARDGIRVNAVSPGTTETPLLLANITPEVRLMREEKIPLGRLGRPNELADLIVYLASPAASYLTGQEVECDGGLSQTVMTRKF